MSISSSHESGSVRHPLAWVESMGGPLIVVPVSALSQWGGSTKEGALAGSGAVVDDYDRACDVDDLAALIAVGSSGTQALLLADEPATSCYLEEHHAFLRWLAADSEADLLAAAEAVLTDPATVWEDCGTWEIDGPAILMDSAEAGADLNIEYPNGGGLPEQAHVPLSPGRWTVRAVHTWDDDLASVGLIQLVPAVS
ncbi:Imm21 family immunity protein [Streptomyces sp. NPDC002917]|uniref:Imm21 family immunity protein n=1 Tax=Streptomyces sp. NPDC002917 TaxID=3364671 RepID=UPI003675D5AC